MSVIKLPSFNDVKRAQEIEEKARLMQKQVDELRLCAKAIRKAVALEKAGSEKPVMKKLGECEGLGLVLRHNPNPNYQDTSFWLSGYGQVLHTEEKAIDGILTWQGRVVYSMGDDDVRMVNALNRCKLRQHLALIKDEYVAPTKRGPKRA